MKIKNAKVLCSDQATVTVKAFKADNTAIIWEVDGYTFKDGVNIDVNSVNTLEYHWGAQLDTFVKDIADTYISYIENNYGINKVFEIDYLIVTWLEPEDNSDEIILHTYTVEANGSMYSTHRAISW